MHSGFSPILVRARIARLCILGLAATLGLSGTMSATFAQEPTHTDHTTERAVQQRLATDPSLQKVDAQVRDGVATLTGEVERTPQRQVAQEKAESVPSVEKVDNQIGLDPQLSVRFADAFEQMQGKLVKLVANLPLLLIAVLIIALAFWLGGVVSRRLRVLRRLEGNNPYMEGLVRNVVRGLIALGGIVLALDLLGATSLVGAVLGSAGVVGLVLGFAFKDIAENYIAGILLSIRRPFNPGDYVRIDTHEGKISTLNSRTTVLMTLEGTHLQLPNSLVFKSVLLNFTRNPNRRFQFVTNVDVATSWSEAMDIGIATMADIDGVLADPAPSAWINGLSDTGAEIQFMGWVNQRQHDLSKTRSEAMRLVRRALRKSGIRPPSVSQKLAITRLADIPLPDQDPSYGESRTQRDMSVDQDIDNQMQRSAPEPDMLTGQPTS